MRESKTPQIDVGNSFASIASAGWITYMGFRLVFVESRGLTPFWRGFPRSRALLSQGNQVISIAEQPFAH